MNWENKTLFVGDNVHVMRGMNSDSVDLIYADPPSTVEIDTAGLLSVEKIPQTIPPLTHIAIGIDISLYQQHEVGTLSGPSGVWDLSELAASPRAAYYNFVRVHSSIDKTPAQATGLADTGYDMEWLAEQIEAARPKPNRPKTYKKRQISK